MVHRLKARLVNGSGQWCQRQLRGVEKGQWAAVEMGSAPSLGRQKDGRKR